MVERIGIRELRQHASRFVERVRRGESFIVTNRSVDTAELGPVRTDVLERLREQGRLRPAIGSLADLPSPGPGSEPTAGTEALQALREERW